MAKVTHKNVAPNGLEVQTTFKVMPGGICPEDGRPCPICVCFVGKHCLNMSYRHDAASHAESYYDRLRHLLPHD